MLESNRIGAGEHLYAGTAVSGLLGGLAGGVGMALYLTGWGVMAGEGLLRALGLFDPTMGGWGGRRSPLSKPT